MLMSNHCRQPTEKLTRFDFLGILMKRWNLQLARLHLLSSDNQKGPPVKVDQFNCIRNFALNPF